MKYVQRVLNTFCATECKERLDFEKTRFVKLSFAVKYILYNGIILIMQDNRIILIAQNRNKSGKISMKSPPHLFFARSTSLDQLVSEE